MRERILDYPGMPSLITGSLNMEKEDRQFRVIVRWGTHVEIAVFEDTENHKLWNSGGCLEAAQGKKLDSHQELPYH